MFCVVAVPFESHSRLSLGQIDHDAAGTKPVGHGRKNDRRPETCIIRLLGTVKC